MTVENTQTSDEGQGPDKSDDSIGLEDLQNLEFHPLANVFPLLEGDELQELADDIKKNRLHDHITLYEGKILDGRNRYNALKLAGSEIARFLFDDFIDDDGDPIEFVISKNIRRRHLTADQRSVIAAELYAKLPKEKFGGDWKSFSAITENEKLPSADSQKQKVATKMEVSVTQLERAAAIRNKDPEKASQVKAGTKKLVDAEKELKPQKPSNSVKDLPPANKTRQQFKEPEVEEITTI